MSDGDRPHREHQRCALPGLGVIVVTVSDTRTLATDRSGALAAELVTAAGHRLLDRVLVPDEPARIDDAVEAALAAPDCSAALFTGGTGVSPRDRTADVVARHFERELPGFGELFRMLSWQEIGAAAMLSRAAAGVRGDRLLVALPGSPAAVRLALEKLLLPELGHLVGELRKREGPAA